MNYYETSIKISPPGQFAKDIAVGMHENIGFEPIDTKEAGNRICLSLKK